MEWFWQKKSTTSVSLRDLIRDTASNAGVKVDATTSLQAVTALACARVIGEGIAQIPLKLHQDRPDGGSDLLKNHPLYKIVNATPNEYLTSYEWRETMGLHLVFSGNSFAIIVRVRGVVVELIPLNPRDVTVKTENMINTYEVRPAQGAAYTVRAEDMLHIKNISWDGYCGLDGIKLASEAIGLSLACQEHGSRTFQNGAQPNGVLTTDANLTDPETRKALRESWESTHGGLKNTGKTALLWGGLKWAATATDNDSAQFLETRLFQVGEVCRWARVLPIMVGHADKAMTFASAEQIFLSHVVHTMGPHYARIEQSLNRALLTQDERDRGMYFKFNVSALMRGSHNDRSSYFAKALGSGGSPAWMSVNEVRALDELNPLVGDLYSMPNPAATAQPAPTTQETIP